MSSWPDVGPYHRRASQEEADADPCVAQAYRAGRWLDYNDRLSNGFLGERAPWWRVPIEWDNSPPPPDGPVRVLWSDGRVVDWDGQNHGCGFGQSGAPIPPTMGRIIAWCWWDTPPKGAA